MYIEQAAPITLAPRLLINGRAAGSKLASARVAVQRARDYPLELVTCDEGLMASAGLTFALDRGGAAINIQGRGTVEQYTAVLRTCAYENEANEPPSAAVADCARAQLVLIRRRHGGAR